MSNVVLIMKLEQQIQQAFTDFEINEHFIWDTKIHKIIRGIDFNIF